MTAFRNELDNLNRFLKSHGLTERNPVLTWKLREYFHQTRYIQESRAHNRQIRLACYSQEHAG